jgi:hypothetical protein
VALRHRIAPVLPLSELGFIIVVYITASLLNVAQRNKSFNPLKSVSDIKFTPLARGQYHISF